MKVGRNDPCPCGSGERYKNCHMGKDGVTENRSNLTLLLVGGAVAIALIAGAVMMKGPRATAPTGAPMSAGGGAVGGGPGTPQPPGPAPAGKVWSPEHGHWHDAPVGAAPGAATSTPITVTPGGTSSPISVTPGATGTPAAAGTLTPQPPGPAPAGKVWSPEHGHWHDAPPGATPAPAGGGQ